MGHQEIIDERSENTNSYQPVDVECEPVHAVLTSIQRNFHARIGK